MSVVLWHYTFSNYNEKARWALDYKGIPHERRALVPGSPRAIRFSIGGTVPVLDMDGERLGDSTDIIAALERRHPDPPLYPDDAAERERALALEDFFDEEAGHDLRRAAFHAMRDDPAYMVDLLSTGLRPGGRRYVRAGMRAGMLYARRRYRINPEDAAESERKLVVALDRIVAETGPSGYLVGDRFTVADLTAAALLFPLAAPPEVQEPHPAPPAPGLARLLASAEAHPGVEWIREIYRRHRGPSAATQG